MSFGTEIFESARYPFHAAARITRELAGAATIVLTGGTTAEKLYRPLAEAGAGWSDSEVFFSDERCVPPTDDASNYGMAKRLLLDSVEPKAVHRMRGEDDPEGSASAYSDEIADDASRGFDLVLLGMGADCHVAAMFPGSPALDEGDAFSAAVDRPDGMKGITLTPPALLNANKILLIVSGGAKAEAVNRVVRGSEEPRECPARLLADHPDATFLLDEPAAAALS